MLQLFEASDVSMGGVLLPDSAKEKPIAGEVVAVGPGKREEDGSRKTPQVVIYFATGVMITAKWQCTRAAVESARLAYGCAPEILWTNHIHQLHSSEHGSGRGECMHQTSVHWCNPSFRNAFRPQPSSP